MTESLTTMPKIQESFYLNIIKKPVQMFLVNGVRLDGNITAFDNYCCVLESDRGSQLIYKHSIATILPAVEANPVKTPSSSTLTLKRGRNE